MDTKSNDGYIIAFCFFCFWQKTSSSRANTLAVSPGISFSGKASWISSLNIMGSENYFANSTVVCFGELLVDFVPTVGGLALADAPAFKKAPGGAPANVAVGICKLGGTAAFVGKVGEDEFGLMLVNVLKTNKVEVKGVRFDADARTALAFVTLKADGEREFMFYRNPSADMVMRPEELDVELIKHAKVFHFGSISLIAEPTKSTHMAAMKIAKDAGIFLSYDPNLRLPLWSSPVAAREGIMSIWNQADIIKVSDEEVNFLTNGGDETLDDVVFELWHPGLKLLVVTDGPEGCRYYTPDFHGKVESFKVHPVDTTGAGDAFMAGLLSKLVDNDFGLLHHEGKLRDALQFANACGAITTTERGAIPALPDTETVLRLMSKESM
jgi:fructokinase